MTKSNNNQITDILNTIYNLQKQLKMKESCS